MSPAIISTSISPINEFINVTALKTSHQFLGHFGADREFWCVFQRGGVDGLNMIVPHADDANRLLRQSPAIPRPGEGEGSALICMASSASTRL